MGVGLVHPGFQGAKGGSDVAGGRDRGRIMNHMFVFMRGDVQFFQQFLEIFVFALAPDARPDRNVGPVEGYGSHAPSESGGLFQQQQFVVRIALFYFIGRVESGDAPADNEGLVRHRVGVLVGC